MFQEKSQFFPYQIQIPKPDGFIDGRQAVTAGKRAASAAFIIKNPVMEPFQILIHKRHFA